MNTKSKYALAIGGALMIFLAAFWSLEKIIPEKWIFFPGLVPMLGMMGANLAFFALEPKKNCPECGKLLKKIGSTPGTLITYIRGFRSCSHCGTKFDRKGELLIKNIRRGRDGIV